MRVWVGGPRLFGLRTALTFGAADVGALASRQSPSPQGQSAFVYVIEGAHGHVKVGLSADPQRRLAALQTASPVPLRLAFTALVGIRASDVEREAHRLLRDRRLAGEWFATSPELASASIMGAAAKLGIRIGSDTAVTQRQDGTFGAWVARQLQSTTTSPWPLRYVWKLAVLTTAILVYGAVAAFCAGFVVLLLTFLKKLGH